eukprot:902198-Amphidinium_carterae.1
MHSGKATTACAHLLYCSCALLTLPIHLFGLWVLNSNDVLRNLTTQSFCSPDGICTCKAVDSKSCSARGR